MGIRFPLFSKLAFGDWKHDMQNGVIPLVIGTFSSTVLDVPKWLSAIVFFSLLVVISCFRVFRDQRREAERVQTEQAELKKQVAQAQEQLKRTRFRVKAGTHIQDGKTYSQGQIVESDKDLIKAFPNKFDVVYGPYESATSEVISVKEMCQNPTKQTD